MEKEKCQNDIFVVKTDRCNPVKSINLTDAHGNS